MALRVLALVSALLVPTALASALAEGDLALLYPRDHLIIRSLKPAKEAASGQSSSGTSPLTSRNPSLLFRRGYSCDAGYGYCASMPAVFLSRTVASVSIITG